MFGSNFSLEPGGTPVYGTQLLVKAVGAQQGGTGRGRTAKQAPKRGGLRGKELKEVKKKETGGTAANPARKDGTDIDPVFPPDARSSSLRTEKKETKNSMWKTRRNLTLWGGVCLNQREQKYEEKNKKVPPREGHLEIGWGN